MEPRVLWRLMVGVAVLLAGCTRQDVAPEAALEPVVAVETSASDPELAPIESDAAPFDPVESDAVSADELAEEEEQQIKSFIREGQRRFLAKGLDPKANADVIIDAAASTFKISREAAARIHDNCATVEIDGQEHSSASFTRALWTRSYRQNTQTDRVLAERGYAIAQYNMGVRYLNGQSVPQDDKLAVEWFQRAANQGFDKAQYNLGCCYLDGTGVEKNLTAAADLFLKAAQQGHDRARFNLARRYELGEGVPKDELTAVYWYTLAAEQGNAMAKNNLGVCYAQGTGVAVNHALAVKWYEEAAAQDNNKARYNLGLIYDDPNSPYHDPLQAIYWWSLAAEYGHVAAQNNLSVVFARGQGIKQDLISAYMWALVAESLAPDSYRLASRTESIARSMSPLQIERATQLANEWLAGFTGEPDTVALDEDEEVSTRGEGW